jgi:hypothetical protein
MEKEKKKGRGERVEFLVEAIFTYSSFLLIDADSNRSKYVRNDAGRGPVLGGPLWDILVLDLRSVDLCQDVH